MTKIVFLDIDGVISPTENNGHEVLHPERIGHYDEQYYLEAAKKHRQKYNMSYLDSYDMYVVDTCWSTLAMQKIKNLLLYQKKMELQTDTAVLPEEKPLLIM